MMGLLNLLPESAASAVVLFDSALRATVILGVALGVAFLLRRRSAALRHWVLALAIAGALIAPLMTLVAPAWRPGLVDRALRSVQTASGRGSATSSASDVTTLEALRLPPPADENASTTKRLGDAAVAGAIPGPLTAVKKAFASTANVTMSVWIAGVMTFAAVLLTGLARLRWLALRSRRVSCGRIAGAHIGEDAALVALTREIAAAQGVRRPIALLSNDRTRLLVTWGYFRPRVMFPAAAARWSEERLRVVISHELAHVRRGDWGTQLAAEILRALFWFNPLVWYVCRRLRAESELACDDEVLNGGVNGADYAAHLLELARVLNSPRHAWLAAPAMARPSSLEGRVSAMLNAHLNRRPVTRSVRTVTCALVLGLTLAVAGFAQSTYYTFSGSVIDPTDRVVPGATLTLTNASRGARYEIKTDAAGRFEFVGLPSGDYGLEVTLPAFATIKETIAITGANLDRRITLQLGLLTETISIRGGGGPVDRTPKRHGFDDATIATMRQKVSATCKPSENNAGGHIKPPSKVKDVRPVYPEELSAANIGGVVTMEATISTGGLVEDLTVVSAPDPGLATAASEAVKQWEYTPTLLNCVPVEAKVGITVSFTPKE
jgi:TonB family protein